ncbi:HD-GYP domain-containing protein [Pseudomonas sp. S1_E04]
MLKCNEFNRQTPDGEAKPFWKDGTQATDTVSSSTSTAAAPVISTSMKDELAAAQAICGRAKTAVVEMFSHARMGRALELEHLGVLVDDISSSIARHPNAFISLARLKSIDDYTYMHSVAVCGLMIALGTELGLSNAMIRRAGIAGLLHDIGKIAIPGAILNKPGRLSHDELQLVRTHPLEGEKTLQATSQMCDMVVDVCLHHHEKIDGTGYPHQLAGDQISLAARMAAICDVYDAITSDRSYNQGWDPAVAIQQMSTWEGHFDDVVFRAFLKSVGIYPVGSIVQLKSGGIGVVIEQHADSLLTPKIKVFFLPVLNIHITPRIIDLSDPTQTDRIIARVPSQRYGFKNTERLWLNEEAPQER